MVTGMKCGTDSVGRLSRESGTSADDESGGTTLTKTRREFLKLGGTVFAVGVVRGTPAPERQGMYGLIGKIRTIPGQRDTLIKILIEGTEAMPGCLSYIIAKDPADADAIWITEAW